MNERHIVAMGGGGLGAPAPEPLYEYVLSLARVPEPKVCFLPTATGDSDEHIVRFYDTFNAMPCTPSHLALFTRTVADIEGFILDKDVVFVGGGNTANMLAVWRLHGVDTALRAAWEAGIVLCGGSAGALCWFEGGTTDSFGLELHALKDGLGFLPGSFCPHYDGEVQRRPLFHRLVEDGVIAPGVAADNFVGFHYVDTELDEVVASHEGAFGYRVHLVDDQAHEEKLPTRLLQ